MLTADQIASFDRDGFVVVPGFKSAEDLDRLRDRALEIVDTWEPSEHRTIFTTDQQERQSNQEFLESASRIWCFFEEEAFGDDGELRQDKRLSINKIGHAQHDLDDEFRRFSYDPALVEVAADLGMHDLLALQSMYIFKQPHIGGEVSCHHDATFLYTEPITVTGFWFAIEDARLDNGCLWAEPGGHRTPLRQVFRRTTSAAGVDMTFEQRDSTPWPPLPPDGTAMVPLEVPAGTLVVLHGLLPHWSDVNRSGVSRHAYTLHCVSAAAEYPSWNWLQRTDHLPLRPLAAG